MHLEVLLVCAKAEFHPTILNSDKGSTQLRQGRFNFDKTWFSPERQNAKLLWSPARFSLLLVNKKRKKRARDNSKLKPPFSNWREFNPPSVADGKGISIRIRPPFCRGQFLPLLSNAAPNKIIIRVSDPLPDIRIFLLADCIASFVNHSLFTIHFTWKRSESII